MTALTRFADQKVLASLFQGVNIGAITWYAALMKYAAGANTAAPATRDNVVEIDANVNPSYARQAIGAFNLTPVAGQTPALVTNAAQIQWAEALTAWGLVVGVGIFDAVNGGNMWVLDPALVANQRDVRIGDRLTINAGELKVNGGA